MLFKYVNLYFKCFRNDVPANLATLCYKATERLVRAVDNSCRTQAEQQAGWFHWKISKYSANIDDSFLFSSELCEATHENITLHLWGQWMARVFLVFATRSWRRLVESSSSKFDECSMRKFHFSILMNFISMNLYFRIYYSVLTSLLLRVNLVQIRLKNWPILTVVNIFGKLVLDSPTHYQEMGKWRLEEQNY